MFCPTEKPPCTIPKANRQVAAAGKPCAAAAGSNAIRPAIPAQFNATSAFAPNFAANHPEGIWVSTYPGVKQPN
eukprot:SAG31_NODE_33414_length_344_cov_0.636735_1_plen_73_part_10